MANPRNPDVLFQVPGSSASDSPPASSRYRNPYDNSDYSPYTPYNPDEAGSFQDIPLLQKQQDRGHRASPSPKLVQKPSRKGKRPQYLTLSSNDSRSEFSGHDLYAENHPSSTSTTDTFINTPSPSLFPRGLPKPAKRHPFAKGFEPPDWQLLILHTVLCVATYPILLIFATIARNKTLFWTRFLVGGGCGLVGVSLGLSLITLGRSHLEAATWATIIHQSRVPDEPGVRLKDLAASSHDPTSAYPAFLLLWNRIMYPGTARRVRSGYDNRPWSLVLVFFILIIAFAASLPFTFGRIVAIDTTVAHQRNNYYEIPIKGDLSALDITQATALEQPFKDFTLTWTLSPFSTRGGLTPAISFPWDNDSGYDTVYFSETSRSQLLPNGTGFGTFDVNATSASIDLDTSQMVGNNDPSKPVEPGVLLRYPRWGIRIHCEKIPDAQTNIIPHSANNITYLFTPRDVLTSLFSSFGMDLPDAVSQPFNATKVLLLNDTLPVGFPVDSTALGVGFYDNGVGHSFKSVGTNFGKDGKGWVTIENVLVRLNTTYTPNGQFSRYGDPVVDASGNSSSIGYDAAVCLELYEPWVLETYNTSIGLPNSLRIVSKGNQIVDSTNEERNIGTPLSGVSRQLNSTALLPAYIVAHDNSVNQMVKDNGRDFFYVPSPTVISFTGGQGPQGYAQLSASFFAQARALADASNVLPYFAGTGTSVARCYPDLILSDAHVNPGQTVGLLLVVLFVGLVAALFVPRLPLSVPRRGFELYSWMAAFHGDELVGAKDRIGIEKNMELKDIEQRVGDLKFRYVL